MEELIGLIPAAGMGTRVHPYTQNTPKPMLEIDGIPNLQRNIELMRDELAIKRIFIVIGYLGEIIQDYFKDGCDHGVHITYITNTAVSRGLAYSILLAKEHISIRFCVILSDEYYINSNHAKLTTLPDQDSLAICGLMHVDDETLIHRNYSCEIKEHRIVELIEKPKVIRNDILGCGTFILHPNIFNYLEQAVSQSKNHHVEFITFLNNLCRQGEKITPFTLHGTYVNINDRDSLELARYHQRQKNFQSNTVALLIYSEGNENNIAFTIKRYKKISDIDTIYVILPQDNSLLNTIQTCDVSTIICPPDTTLYGEKIKYALKHVYSDIIIIAEASYSFPGRDVTKLLAYLMEADMVIGTRTTRQLIEQGSEMRGSIRIANIILAKFIEILWWKYDSRFTDVGCTFRVIWKTTFEKIQDHLTAKGPEFSAEMMIEVLESKGRIIEIPVNYFDRSVEMYKKYRNFKTFWKLLRLIISKRFFQVSH